MDIWDIIAMIIAVIVTLLIIGGIIAVVYAIWVVSGILTSLIFSFAGFTATTVQYVSMQIVLCMFVVGILNVMQTLMLRIGIYK